MTFQDENAQPIVGLAVLFRLPLNIVSSHAIVCTTHWMWPYASRGVETLCSHKSNVMVTLKDISHRAYLLKTQCEVPLWDEIEYGNGTMNGFVDNEIKEKRISTYST